MRLNNEQLLQINNTLEAMEIEGYNNSVENGKYHATVYIYNENSSVMKTFTLRGYSMESDEITYCQTYEEFLTKITDYLNAPQRAEIHEEISEILTRPSIEEREVFFRDGVETCSE